MKKSYLTEDRRQDLIDSILLNYEDYADNVGINFIGPTDKELESYTDEELEQAFKESESDREYSVGQMNHLDSLGVDNLEDDLLPALDQEPVYSDEDYPEDNLPTHSGMGRGGNPKWERGRHAASSSLGFRNNLKKESSIMKITANQLRKIIRETIEETMEETDGTISPEEFESIVTESKIRIPLSEDFGILTVTLGTVLGILAYKVGKGALGVASVAAQNLAYNLEQEAQAKLRAKAEAAKQANLDAAVASLANDQQLASMFKQLIQLQNSGTSKQVSALSKQITAYVNDNMADTGASPMDVRIALSKRAGAARSRY
jgi:hypothetical protein